MILYHPLVKAVIEKSSGEPSVEPTVPLAKLKKTPSACSESYNLTQFLPLGFTFTESVFVPAPVFILFS